MRHQACKEDHSARAPRSDRIILNLTISGAREHLMELLEKMDKVDGFSVLDGSFQARRTEEEKPGYWFSRP
jgi:hypothetical protein